MILIFYLVNKSFLNSSWIFEKSNKNFANYSLLKFDLI